MASLDSVKTALKTKLPENLIDDLFAKFAELKRDFLLGAHHSSAAGHFTEVMADILLDLVSGAGTKRPKNLDELFLRLENETTLPDSFRLEMARALRSLNTFRNKRTCHKTEIDPNRMDAKCAAALAQWVIAELIRVMAGLSHEDAASVIEWITAPLGGIIEDFGEFKTVLAECSAEEEMLLLMSTYPDWVKPARIKADMKRRKVGTVSTVIKRLYDEKDTDRQNRHYKLTRKGLRRATVVYTKLMAEIET